MQVWISFKIWKIIWNREGFWCRNSLYDSDPTSVYVASFLPDTFDNFSANCEPKTHDLFFLKKMHVWLSFVRIVGAHMSCTQIFSNVRKNVWIQLVFVEIFKRLDNRNTANLSSRWARANSTIEDENCYQSIDWKKNGPIDWLKDQ